MRGNGANLAGMADTTRLIFEAPRTVLELTQLTELTRDTIANHLQALEAEGLVGVVSIHQSHNGRQSGPPSQRWGWIKKAP